MAIVIFGTCVGAEKLFDDEWKISPLMTIVLVKILLPFIHGGISSPVRVVVMVMSSMD